MPHTYRIDHKKRIIFYVHRGELSIEDAEKLYFQSISDPGYDETYFIFIDGRKCRFIGDEKDLKRHSQLFRKATTSYGIKHAVLVGSPIETAMAFYYREFLNDCRKVEVFSTYEAAMEWLEGSDQAEGE